MIFTSTTQTKFFPHLAAAFAISWLCAPPAHAVELKPQANAGFDRYIRCTEARLANERGDGHFLILDSLPGPAREEAYVQVRSGQLYLQPLHTTDKGQPIVFPGGLIHHWVGVEFVPGATLARALHVSEDYGHEQDFYKPDVRISKVLEKDGHKAKVYLQLYDKSLVTVAVNVNLDAEYVVLGPTQAEGRSSSTRITEVENVGRPNEREFPTGDDHGYLWRLNNYRRLEEKDGGVYIQIEWIAMSRSIPWEVAWLVNPLVESLPKGILSGLLGGTRKAVESTP